MATHISPRAGKPAPPSALVDVARLVTAYYTGIPDVAVAAQRVAFGTSGHRGSSFDLSFNERHVLAITQAICRYRKRQGIDGPLYLGIDTHALSAPACASALEVLAANGVQTMLAEGDEYTPTPAVSQAFLTYNRGRSTGLADGIVPVLTPDAIAVRELAGEEIDRVIGKAPGNGAAIGGIKVTAKSGWFAARPSATEDIYKIYAESVAGADHLQLILKEAQGIVDRAIAGPTATKKAA